ncbi:MAG: ATP-binding protein [Bacteroidota bacterium]
MRVCFYIAILVTALVQIQAQTSIVPERLSIEDGLSQGYVATIHQDREGFLWFGTKNGLNRYDGRQFKVFTNDPDDPFSISNDWVFDIHEKGDFLILVNQSPYLNLFHKKTERFYRVPIRARGVEAFEVAVQIIEDRLGYFWVQFQRQDQVIRLSFPSDFWTNLSEDTDLASVIEVSFVSEASHLFQAGEDIFIVKDDKTLKIDRETLQTTITNPTNLSPRVSHFQKITPQLAWGKVKNLIYGEGYQLFRLEQGQWQLLETNLFFTTYFIHDESANLLWVQKYEDNEILIFDIATLAQADQLQISDALYRITEINAGMTTWYTDRSGTTWMGTGGLGVRKMSPRRLAVKTSMSGVSVYNHLFSSTADEVLFHRFGTDEFYQAGASAPLYNAFQFIKSTNIDRIYWLNEQFGAGYLLTQQEQAASGKHDLQLYYYQDENLEKRAQWTVVVDEIGSELSLMKGQQGDFFMLFANHFIQYDPQSEQSITFHIDLFHESKPAIFYAAQTANGNWWIGTTQGLIQAQKTQRGFDFQWVEGLRNPICASVLTDPKDGNILWIGTKGGGLHWLDTRSMEFEYLNTRNGLPNDVIYSVLNDERGNLWMSSNKGIISYHPETGKIRNFTAADGMQSDEFNTYAFGKSPTGELLFGGINGLNVFHPDDLQENQFVPEVRITGLAVNNQVVGIQDSTGILSEAIEFTSAIRLPFQQNSINLSFAALEFTAPKKNTFSYYLEGAEAEWIHTTTENRASYLNIAPGDYTFKIKAANGDQVWSESITTLDITVLPPWYRTKLAYLFYVLLLGGIVWLYIRFQRNRLQLQYSLELEQKEADRLKELDAFRSRLFTNITHEFRTPLTVIMGTSEQLETQDFAKHPARKRLALIRRNGRNLLNLVNQMLDLSKIEHNKLQINYRQGDLLAYLRYITESFYSLANASNVLLKVKSTQAKIWMDYDEEKMRQIISNLLSNAIKYTPSGGNVTLTANPKDEQLEIAIQDTGKGIPAIDLPHIFDRFYQADDEIAKAGGTGIGLALTYELVQLLDGEIRVASEIDKGTIFTLLLPLKQVAPLVENLPKQEISTNDSRTASLARKKKLKNAPRLLLIEDNRDVVEYLTTCLEQDYQLYFAYNGQAGVALAFEYTPDLIISDVMMPEKTGFELTDILKKDERTSHIPIVLLTAKADIESRLTGLRSGADVYLPKPFHQEELLLSLENLLAVRQKLQAKYQTIALATNVPKVTRDQEAFFLQRLRQLLEAELHNPNLKVEDITKQMAMGRSNLYAKLTAITGMSFNVYLRTLRLQKAQHLLTTTNLAISQIAYQVGFNNAKYFSTQFTKAFGCSPTQFRVSKGE